MGILSKKQKFAAAALLLAASALLSRLMGLVRDKIISFEFGASGEADMYFAAFVVPDIINYLLAGGFMSITLIPLLAKGFEKDGEDAWRFFSCVCLWMGIGSGCLTLAGGIWAESFASLVAPGFDDGQKARLAFFMRIILPAQIFFCCGACFTALLFLRRQFTVPALTPLIYNGFIIIFGVGATWLGLANGMTGYCAGVTTGAFLGAFLLPLLVARQSGLKLKFTLFHPWLLKFLWIALPLMLGQTVVMLDEQFLRIFGSMLTEGNVSLLNYARRIEQVPIALMGQAIAVASYPFLVRHLANGDIGKFHGSLNKAMRDGLELIIPAAGLMLVCAAPILTIIFQGGQFGREATLACAPLTQIMLASTPFWIIYMTLVRGYYALEDTLTPAITGTILTLACLPLYRFLAVSLGASGIAVVSGASIVLYVLWLMAIWRKRQGGNALDNLALAAAKSLACTVPPMLAVWWLFDFLQGFWLYSDFVTACLLLFLGCLVFAPIFLGLSSLINPQFNGKILNMLKRKKA